MLSYSPVGLCLLSLLFPLHFFSLTMVLELQMSLIAQWKLAFALYATDCRNI